MTGCMLALIVSALLSTQETQRWYHVEVYHLAQSIWDQQLQTMVISSICDMLRLSKGGHANQSMLHLACLMAQEQPADMCGENSTFQV